MKTAPRPIHCPHGSDLTPESARHDVLLGTYEDGCRCSSGIPPMFWCGEDEMSKPNGVRIYEGEYLAAWDEALVLNAGDDLWDEAVREDYLRTYEANDHAEYQRFMDTHPPRTTVGYDVTWGQDPIVTREHAGYLGEVPWTDRAED